MIKSICIVRLSALGDVLMLVPLIRTLQANFPAAQLTWVISPPAYDLVEGLDGVEFIVIDKPYRVRDYWKFKQIMRGRQFDVLLAAQSSLRANLLYPLICATRKIGYDSLRAKDCHQWFINETISPGRDHTLDGFLRFADALLVEKKVIRWDLPISKVDIEWARAQLSSSTGFTMLVNPAASKSERSWLPERYIEVIRYAKTHLNAHVVLIGGPGDADKVLGDRIAQEVAVLNLIGKTRLKQLMALISQADLLLCPDTGPSHMATAVATPVIALHAVTSSDVSGPYTYRHLAVDFYKEALAVVLKTIPEEHVWGTHAHGNETMRLVPVDAVISRLNELI